MSVATSLSDVQEDVIPLARSNGDLKLRVEKDGLKDLYQSGCAKARFPKTYNEPMTAVLINTAGGLTGGDRIRQDITVGADGALCVTSQAAERLYNRFQGQARIETALSVQPGARLEWLPQECIVFNESGLARETSIRVEAGAELLALESFVFGREAHGERVDTCFVQDQWKIHQGDELIWADGLRLWGDVRAHLEHPAAMAGMRACATLVYVGEKAETLLTLVREVFGERKTEGASRMGDLLLIRVLAAGAAELRKRLELIIDAVREEIHGQPVALPRTWSC